MLGFFFCVEEDLGVLDRERDFLPLIVVNQLSADEFSTPVESRGAQQPEPWSWCEDAALHFFLKAKQQNQRWWRWSEEGRWLDAKPAGGFRVTAEVDKQSKLVLACWWPEGVCVRVGRVTSEQQNWTSERRTWEAWWCLCARSINEIWGVQ